ncbi:MAG TPA: Tex family protein [Candidatus Obscuribacterales bacterium]
MNIIADNAKTNTKLIAEELRLSAVSVDGVLKLLADGSTVPFIARYRKEATGGLDEVAIAAIRDRAEALDAFDKRRASILKSLEERNLLTEDLSKRLARATSLNELEDIYLPFRPKRRTRAAVAREKGLEPLAQRIFSFQSSNPIADAAAFVNVDKGVGSADEALSGARDIIAEWISEDVLARAEMRSYWAQRSTISSVAIAGKQTEGAKYSDYFDCNESAKTVPSHRALAMFRGESEGFLNVTLAPPSEEALSRLEHRFVTTRGAAADQIILAVQDSYKRLLAPSMETELRNDVKARSDAEAIKVFSNNVRELLLAPPLGQKRVLSIDPGMRTGCKVVCLNEQGALQHHDVLYLLGNAASEAETKLVALVEKYSIEAIAIGNGTGGREATTFVRQLMERGRLKKDLPILSVNESGASIYSASPVAREEFPNHDVTVRGAVSIGRRLLDPLAELVKLDPQSIGVGQYQHDVDQSALKKSLDDVVMSCVNSVGVEVNTASKQLLMYVSGLGPQLAGAIVEHRTANGAFRSREQLKKVKRLGAKAFEQAAGFLRIRDADNPLDASAVHPESYGVVKKIADDNARSVKELIGDESLAKKVDLKRYITPTVGLPTLQDILSELAKPGRDPRQKLEQVQFAEGVNTPEDLRPGMKLDGIVTNVTAFGAFVDIGVHQDGLVHISQLANRFVKDPHEVVKVGQKVHVAVMDVDLARNRIALTMKD